MIVPLFVSHPQDAYDWARAAFNSGGFHLVDGPSHFYILSSGCFCILSLPKRRGTIMKVSI